MNVQIIIALFVVAFLVNFIFGVRAYRHGNYGSSIIHFSCVSFIIGMGVIELVHH